MKHASHWGTVLGLCLATPSCAETVTWNPTDAAVDTAPETDGATVQCPVTPGASLAVMHTTDMGTVTLHDPGIPLDAEELAFNTARSPADTWVAWSMSTVPVGTGTVIFYGKYLVRPGYLNFQGVGTGIARQASPGAPVVRDPGLLFTPPVPGFSSGAVLEGDTVYAYACNIQGFLDAVCRVARAPLVQVSTPSAWTVWNGTRWDTDLSSGAVVATGMNGMSMTYNRHLGRYLAVYGGILSSTVYLRTTVHPEGPWSAPVLAFTGLPAGDGHADYNAAQRPDLQPADGCTVVITYAHPTRATAVETRRVDVELQ